LVEYAIELNKVIEMDNIIEINIYLDE